MSASCVRVCFLAVAGTALASADVVVFHDDFESGNLAPLRWAVPGSGFVTNDPTGAINKVLAFGHGSSGGDVFSVPLPNAAGTYRLSFEFYEAASPSAIPDHENIGYIGTDQDTVPGGPNELWVWNARDNPVIVGQWNHILLDISPITDPFNLKLEVAGPSSSAAGIYFDNVEVTAVPEPTSMLLLGAALAGMGWRFRHHTRTVI